MNKSEVFVIGLMSGTSLDGIDLVYVKFDKNNYQFFEILESKTVSYSYKWKQDLQNSINFSSEELEDLDVNYGKHLGYVVNDFIDEFQIENIDFIASHGHTVLHQPEKGITLQVGNGLEIANITKHKVVYDFRTQDVELGGQGAPLVPIGDELLFSEYDYCLNLGGFANVSFKKGSKRIAYDICPVNIVLNKYAQKIGLEYDDRGKVAAKGNYNEELDVQLQKLHFYKEQAPKSLGLEWVKEKVFPKIDNNINKPEDVLRTFTDHVAWAIAREFPKEAKVLVTGGGAYNDYLIQKIKSIKNIDLIIPSKKIIDFKEALIFAFLGVLKLDNQVNCLCSVTGAEKNHSSGVVVNPSMVQ
ncbi:anhydro-N-acetylmuramic acid kinase [Polaribacter sp. Z022]|uniref:anhydro-N-acetylmuramic acid kinase n=1 Tax=Polaribacter sp. Z022 TaxID=2927125 RepID=UPI00201FC432|nr:anhydro-N-acetylmuramic acid kinase [Polaribacter sp. Z022]MCL7754827.1 anhydro-N-acetylmuramic acid kinase [Polaribacter sp. Z022]